MTEKEYKDLDFGDYIVHDKYGLCAIRNSIGTLLACPSTYKGMALLASDKGKEWNGEQTSIEIGKLQLKDMRFASLEERKLQIDDYLFAKLHLNSVLNFCQNHKVDVIHQSDMQYYCLIDWKDGDKPYAIELTNIEALIKGIIAYEKAQIKKG